jgi:probable HAF family extracellular repeat protein
MNPQRIHPLVSLLSIACVCAAQAASPAHAWSDHALPDRASSRMHAPQYRIEKLATLGGSSAVGFSINNRGWIAGRSNLADGRRHATLWRGDRVTDLGTFGGPNSVVRWPVKNILGVVTGFAQTAEPDPLGEYWSCSAFFPSATATGYRCLGFRWKDGVMTALPTLGGTHSFAAGTNNLGYTVGWAENTVRDPTCTPPQVLQFRPVVWRPDGRAVKLPLPAGDSSGAATAINDRGWVVGISGLCDQAVGRETARHAVLWRGGRATDIGNLGGVAWHAPNSINLRGDIVGFGNHDPADGINFAPHAFVKFADRPIRGLGTLQTDPEAFSEAWGINESRQIVGRSCDSAGVCLAFLWQNSAMIDLQSISTSADGLVLIAAYDIDDFGRITGQAFEPASGQFIAYRATPQR